MYYLKKATEQKSEKLQNEIVYLSSSASEPKLRDENKKLQEVVEASERTISSLKREISSLNLSRYSFVSVMPSLVSSHVLVKVSLLLYADTSWK